MSNTTIFVGCVLYICMYMIQVCMYGIQFGLFPLAFLSGIVDAGMNPM